MKRIVTLIAAILCGVAASAYNQEIRSIKIACVLDSLGTAHITETWDVEVAKGTEWYLVRNNLRDIEIEDFSVTDEDGRAFSQERSWDIDRDIDAKAYRCGINRTDSGCELCWGIGTYGPHKWTVRYRMTNAAKSLNDYDMLHLQFVSPGLSTAPKDVSLVLQVQGEKIDTTCARIWGFGYNGTCEFQNGDVVMQSSEPFVKNSSLILLLRLDKGIIQPQSIQNRDFQDVLDIAMDGADFGSDKTDSSSSILDFIMEFLFFGGWLLFVIPGVMLKKRADFKRMTGVKNKKEINWCRDIPFNGDIAVGDYVLKQTGERTGKAANVASALILRMIQVGALGVHKISEKDIEITFNDQSKIESWDSYANSLWKMMFAASGSDGILQNKEFSKWSKQNSERVSQWVKNVEAKGAANFKKNYSVEEGQTEARKMLGLKKFLLEFTMIKERATQEVALWEDYLVFAALLGVADKVAKELRDINPQVLNEASSMNGVDIYDVLFLSRSLARAITTAQASEASKSFGSGSSGGFGGGASFGGGGGFSGGGFGGGSR